MCAHLNEEPQAYAHGIVRKFRMECSGEHMVLQKTYWFSLERCDDLYLFAQRFKFGGADECGAHGMGFCEGKIQGNFRIKTVELRTVGVTVSFDIHHGQSFWRVFSR